VKTLAVVSWAASVALVGYALSNWTGRPDVVWPLAGGLVAAFMAMVWTAAIVGSKRPPQ